MVAGNQQTDAPTSSVREAPNVGDAVWAHHKWPRLGLFAGFGVGVVVSIIVWLGWWSAILFIAACTVLGCLAGFLLAAVIYRSTQY